MAKRNSKTKPPQRSQRVYGETDADDSFVPPDRVDQVALSESDDRPGETIDFRTGDTTVDPPPAEGADDVDDDVVPLTERPRPRSQEDRNQERTQQRPEPRQRQARGDDDGLSRKVQKRVARERAIANRERTLREQAEAKLREERVARQATDDRLLRIERTQAQVEANGDVKSLQAQIDALAPQIATAVEAGNTKEALAAQIKLGELQASLAVLKQDLKYRSMDADRRTREEEEARRRGAGAPPVDTSRQIHPGQMAENIERGNEFKRANRHWWRKNAEARDASVEIDKEILQDIQDGVLEFEPYSEEHFDEMAERMHEDFPDLELCDLEGEPYQFDEDQNDQGGNARREARVQQNNGRRGNGSGRPPQGRDGSVRGGRQMSEVEMARRGQVNLTPEDFKEMRTFKLDPNNADHKKAFAKERARTILKDAAREGAR
jgi:hypothetical protein